MSPHTEVVQHLLGEWMHQRRYLRNPLALERFQVGKFAWLAGRAYPEASFDALLLVGTYMSWLFVLDDLCDEAELGCSPERLRELHEELLEHMRHPQPLRGDEGPLVAGLADLWARLCERAAPGWVERFTRTFESYAQGCVWEAENRARARVPSLAEYMEWRRHTSALYLFFDLVELSEGVSLSDEELDGLQSLRERANDGVAWFNDIVSLEKELRAGDVHNLVVVLRQEYRLSVQEAVARAARLLNARMREYVELEQRLPSLGVERDARLQRYLTGLRCWVRGNMDWSYESGRYRQAQLKAAVERYGS
ncbi:MAG TPA: hypothetical protein VF815_41225 [Myxococcaceae bacterium]